MTDETTVREVSNHELLLAIESQQQLIKSQQQQIQQLTEQLNQIVELVQQVSENPGQVMRAMMGGGK